MAGKKAPHMASTGHGCWPEALAELLIERARRYNTPEFIGPDPIAIPHRFSDPEDIALAGFFAATLAWGNRQTVLASTRRLLQLMDNSPAQFIRDHRPADRKRLAPFVHRTFNGADAQFFVQRWQQLLLEYGHVEAAFLADARPTDPDTFSALAGFSRRFWEVPHPVRSRKHVSDPARGSAAKRLNMFLRWMVRRDRCGVDFGLWTRLAPHQLVLPLDVHTGRVARALGLLTRRADDWTSVLEVTARLRELDPQDPARFDYALFGLGLHERPLVDGWLAPKKGP